uniref:phosphoinositide phospholipase C n=1 Tax=Kalanchoe fedtschenkoi TaxID=63787 RepID=A0A7N0T6G0_KALFE
MAWVHRRTLTTPVSLLRCLKSIKEYAFVKSPYPVIITLEDHLTPDLQAKVAEIDSGQDDEVNNGFSERKSQPPRAPEYKRLNALHAGKPKNGLRDALKVMTDKVKRLSLSELALERAASSHGTDVVRFTQKNMLRIYPKGTRGYGKSLWLMHGMFRSNGECGYVKKPDLLMKKGPKNEVFDPRKTLPVKTTLKVSVYFGDGWRLDFSQTHFDSYSPPDFYTKVHMLGVPADAAKHRTRIIEDDWNPVWNEEFTFPLTVPELALLQIEVREYDRSDKDDFGGQTCLPVSDLRPGIRSVPQFDKRGDQLKSR